VLTPHLARSPAVVSASSTVSPYLLPLNRKTRPPADLLTTTACTNQYGAPSNGWGDRYGGIHSKSECDGFPAALKAGCNWRFDWFVHTSVGWGVLTPPF
jgi:hypothetical protein